MYSLGEDEACRSWAEMAIELAQYVGDEGKLEEQMRTNYRKLSSTVTSRAADDDSAHFSLMLKIH